MPAFLGYSRVSVVIFWTVHKQKGKNRGYKICMLLGLMYCANASGLIYWVYKICGFKFLQNGTARSSKGSETLLSSLIDFHPSPSPSLSLNRFSSISPLCLISTSMAIASFSHKTFLVLLWLCCFSCVSVSCCVFGDDSFNEEVWNFTRVYWSFLQLPMNSYYLSKASFCATNLCDFFFFFSYSLFAWWENRGKQSGDWNLTLFLLLFFYVLSNFCSMDSGKVDSSAVDWVLVIWS